MWFWLMPSEAPPKSLTIQVAVSRNTLTGTVFDATGQAVGGATIILTGPGGPRTMVTTADGKFQFAGLAPGTYTVVAQLGDLSAQTQATISAISAPPGTPIFVPGAVAGPTLAEVSGIGPTFRARLEANGVTLAAEVASMEAPHLAEMLRTSEARANTIINSARRLLMG
jgi:predicted flap endonuclease-1-like 5' DNA nuclease